MERHRVAAALAIGVIGLALVGFEAVRVLRSTPLGTLGAVLLYVGLGLFVIAAALLLSTEARDESGSAAE